MSPRRPWTAAELATLRARYADTPTAELAGELDCRIARIYHKAHSLGLHKSAAYLASPAAGRLRSEQTPAQKANRFQPGQVPHNKGLRRPGWHAGRMRETQFKPGAMHGAARRRYRPIGSTRLVYGNLERKISDDPAVYPAARWKPVHRLRWEAAHGPVPAGHLVVFKPGQHTAVDAEITLDRLECISRAESMRRNSYHTNYPKAIGRVIQLRGVLTRQINNHRKQWSTPHEKQD